MTGTWRDVTEADGEWWKLPVERLRVNFESEHLEPDHVDECWNSQMQDRFPIGVVYAGRKHFKWFDYLGNEDASRVQILEPVPNVVAWTFLTVPDLTMRVRRKADGTLARVEFRPHQASVFFGDISSQSISYEQFLADYTQLDGSPCGETRNNTIKG